MSSLPVLVLNSGSSSLKFSMYEAGSGLPSRTFDGAVEGIGAQTGQFWIRDHDGKEIVGQRCSLGDVPAAFSLLAQTLESGLFPAPEAIGHRIVFPGPRVRENQRIGEELITEIERYAALAPLHTPMAVYLMREALRLYPRAPSFAVLDTYFHRTLPEVVTDLPIPAEYAAMGVRRYGYHGISYESILHQLQPDIPERLIVAHLGNGASLCAIRHGESLDTSMGLTPAGGIISGSRSGDLDPGVVVFIQQKIAEDVPSAVDAASRLESVISEKSGLLGMSGISGDMRELRKAIMQDNRQARRAVDKFTWTIARWIGSFYAELGGLDMLVFTGGIGENDAASRLEICSGLGALGVAVDGERNNAHGKTTISPEGSPVQVRVIPAAEDLIIVNHVLSLIRHESERATVLD